MVRDAAYARGKDGDEQKRQHVTDAHPVAHLRLGPDVGHQVHEHLGQVRAAEPRDEQAHAHEAPGDEREPARVGDGVGLGAGVREGACYLLLGKHLCSFRDKRAPLVCPRAQAQFREGG